MTKLPAAFKTTLPSKGGRAVAIHRSVVPWIGDGRPVGPVLGTAAPVGPVLGTARHAVGVLLHVGVHRVLGVHRVVTDSPQIRYWSKNKYSSFSVKIKKNACTKNKHATSTYTKKCNWGKPTFWTYFCYISCWFMNFANYCIAY